MPVAVPNANNEKCKLNRALKNTISDNGIFASVNDAGRKILCHAYLLMFDNLDNVIQALAAKQIWEYANNILLHSQSLFRICAREREGFVPKFTFASAFYTEYAFILLDDFFLSFFLSFFCFTRNFSVFRFTVLCALLLIFRVHSNRALTLLLIFIVVRSSMEFVKYLLCVDFCCASCVWAWSFVVFLFSSFTSGFHFIYFFHSVFSFSWKMDFKCNVHESTWAKESWWYTHCTNMSDKRRTLFKLATHTQTQTPRKCKSKIKARASALLLFLNKNVGSI